jgi:hypothetical protein
LIWYKVNIVITHSNQAIIVEGIEGPQGECEVWWFSFGVIMNFFLQSVMCLNAHGKQCSLGETCI